MATLLLKICSNFTFYLLDSLNQPGLLLLQIKKNQSFQRNTLFLFISKIYFTCESACASVL